MVEGGYRPRLALEPLPALVGGHLAGKDLQRHLASSFLSRVT